MTAEASPRLKAWPVTESSIRCRPRLSSTIASAIGMSHEFQGVLPSAVTKDVSASAIAFSDAEIKERMRGNLCRCSAYVGICEAICDVPRGRGGAMKNFAYARAPDAQAALHLLSQMANAQFLGGGTNLVDLRRENIEQPNTFVGVTGLPLNQIEERSDGRILISAAVKNTAVAQHRFVRERYPFLAQAVLFGASGQIRNIATVAGNLMHWTRCIYFYGAVARCNKRRADVGYDAIGGFNRMHAILGTSEICIATHPSDMCVPLAALDAIGEANTGETYTSILQRTVNGFL
jgi:xanthine dehydrogenase YagS FAD-binding subunit